MTRQAYCHLEVRGADHGHGAMIAPILSRLMAVMHGYFVEHSGIYALDFPGLKPGSFRHPVRLGRIVRVFFDTREQGDALLENIERHPVVSSYIMTGRVRTFGEYAGPWVSLHRLRVAPRSQPNNRHRDLSAQNDNQPPFLQMRSRSTNQSFSLLIDRRIHPVGSVITDGCPNSYGLSGVQPVFLPDFPL